MKNSLAAKAIRILGNVLILTGAVLLVTATAVYGYGEYQRILFEREQPQFSDVVQVVESEAPTDSDEEAEPTVGLAELKATPSPTSVEDAGSTLAPAAIKTTPTPTPTPNFPPAKPLSPVWIKIPKIAVDSKVVPAKIYNDQWLVPKFYVGHLEGTSNPGREGNVAMSGHIESIGAGNVFARLGELAVGDLATVYTQENAFRYRVTEKKTVLNTDVSVVRPTKEPLLTLITCTGTFNPVTQDYSHRLIIVATLEQIGPPSLSAPAK